MIIRVEDFKHIHRDGIHDDAPGIQFEINRDASLLIQAAIDAATSEEDEVIFPANDTLFISRPIRLKKALYRGEGVTLRPYPGKEFDCWWSDDPTVHAVFSDPAHIGLLFTNFCLNGDTRVYGGMIYR